MLSIGRVSNPQSKRMLKGIGIVLRSLVLDF